MKKFLALFLALIMVVLCCACGDSETTKKKKKKVVYIQKEATSSEDDTSSEDNTSQNTVYDNSDYILESEVQENENNATVQTGTANNIVSAVSKVTSSNIGKNYYIFAPETMHPGVVDMDAKYVMTAMDRRNRTLEQESMVLACSDSNVKIDGNIVTIPYSVRSSGKKVTVTMYNKKYPNRTGSYTFDFAVQFTAKPTFLENFDVLDPNVWTDDWYNNRMPMEEITCENGELVLYADVGTKSIELSTTGTFNQAYGCFSAKIKMPLSGLSNVAFWLCTEQGVVYLKNIQRPTESGGEIDIVEYFPTWGDHKTSCTVHWNGWSNYHTSEFKYPQVEQILRGEYHIYSAVWTSEAIYWYLDEDLIWTYTGDGVGANAGPMQILVQHTNTGVDSDWGGTYDASQFPNESRWDWIKVYGLEKE